MKAIRAHAFGGPDVLQLDDVDDPVPGPDEVVIDVRAAGVNPADTYMRNGTYAIVPDLPYVPGGDAAGVISAVGDGVDAYAIGDRVFAGTAQSFDFTGCYAEKLKRKTSEIARLPEGVDFAQAAAFGVSYTTAHYALFERGGARAGETVFIHGASGSVGTSAIQLAKRAGLKVIGSGGTAKGLDLIRAEGADHAVDHTRDGYLDEVREQDRRYGAGDDPGDARQRQSRRRHGPCREVWPHHRDRQSRGNHDHAARGDDEGNRYPRDRAVECHA